MLQAVIPLEAFRAELRRRLEMIRRQKPFGVRSIGSFTGPAQARAVETQPPKGDSPMTNQTTMQTIGEEAAHNLITELCNLDGTVSAAHCLEIEILNAARIGPDDLTAERLESIRAFCEIIAPMLFEHCNQANQEIEPIHNLTESEGGEA